MKFNDTADMLSSDEHRNLEQSPVGESRNATNAHLSALLQGRLGLAKGLFFPEASKEQLLAALDDLDWRVRIAAVQALIDSKEDILSDILLRALKDSHAGVRVAAIRAVGNLGERTPIEPLITALHDDEWTVRVAAATALGKQTERAPLEPLLACLSDEHEGVRAAAIQALGNLGNRAPGKVIINALRATEWSIREAAVLALGELGEYSLLKSLLVDKTERNEIVLEAIKVVLLRSDSQILDDQQKGFFGIRLANENNQGLRLRDQKNHGDLHFPRESQKRRQSVRDNLNDSKLFKQSERQLGPYELLETLGSGSSAKVYRARDKFLDREVAMKVLHTPLIDEQAERFLDEARIVASLDHPNIVRVLGFNIEQSIPYLVMEYAPLGSLRQRHPVGARLPLADVVSYVKKIASALQYAHDRGETHLDIKPENMLLGKHEEVLISDFGIAGKIQLQHAHMMRSAVGTVPYMAPEQIRRQPGKATDQYALAILVYEWLVGTYPFAGTKEEIASQHLYADPPSLCDRNPMVPSEVEEVIMKALSKDPKQRYPSISAFAFALEEVSNLVPRVQQVTPLSASNTGQQAGKRDTFLVIPCLIVSLLLLLFLMWSTIAAVVHSVSVTITPVSTQLTQNETLFAVTNYADPTRQQVQARFIQATSQPMSKTVIVAGVGQAPGKQAQGYLTFYNGLPVPQTIPQGTPITATDGIIVVTSVSAIIPPANPPYLGTVSIPAHALQSGSNGNIPSAAIDEACCSSDGSISVKNLASFTAGEDPQPYTYVRQSDIDGADAAIEPALKAMVQQSLQKQIHNNEASAGPMRCTSQLYTDYPVNSRTTSIKVTMSLHCTEEVYDKAEAEQLFRLMLKNEANRRLGARYGLSGRIAVQLLQISPKDAAAGSLVLRANVSGIWAYQFSNAQKQTLLRLIDGKKPSNVSILLSKQAGVSMVDIEAPLWVPWFIQETLPINASHATLNIAPVS